MADWLPVVASAFWLGILTSISPCPLATNIAAVSFLGRRLTSPRQILLSGLLYALGRTIAYMGLAVVLVASLLAAPILSQWLQESMNQLLGPILVLAGMVLLDLLPLRLPGVGGQWLQRRAATWELGGSLLLGVLFALSFCPVSAALFFGSLLPLALRQGSSVVVPALYGVGTAVPVVAFAVLVAAGAQSVSRTFEAVRRLEPWARQATGVIFVGIGIYYTMRYIFGIIS